MRKPSQDKQFLIGFDNFKTTILMRQLCPLIVQTEMPVISILSQQSIKICRHRCVSIDQTGIPAISIGIKQHSLGKLC